MRKLSWDTRFGFFWYNDEEIFHFSQEDFNKKAKAFADSGINTVITFSCTHFRWTWRPYWRIINETIEKIVDACHRYGIRVVEHHSSHLTFDPLDSEDWDYIDRILGMKRSSIDSWKGLREHFGKDYLIDGKPFSSFRQIDGRTGKWARSPYHGYCMCFNNPDYRKAYLSYLEDVYQTGVDGIMTDDVQWFGEGHACACAHCRRLFYEKTGYALPDSGDEWNAFHGDYSNPVYIAWERFRRESTADFQRMVNRHFNDLGLDLLRPNYVSAALYHNYTGYPFDATAQLWDCIMQENCFSSIIRHSWPMDAMEAVHRYALARRNGVPSISLYYPDREDTYYFGWALANSWGQSLTATCEVMDMSVFEKKYRPFEKIHKKILQEQDKQADIAFYFSLKTRDYVKNSIHECMNSLIVWMQAAYFSNQAFDMVFENDPYETLLRYRYIALPDVSMLSEDELGKLRCYAAHGGHLIISGIPGQFNDRGEARDIGEISGYFGIGEPPYPLKEKIRDEAYLDGTSGVRCKISMMTYANAFREDGSVVLRTSGGLPVGVSVPLGKGRVFWTTVCAGALRAQWLVFADRTQRRELRVPCPYYAVDDLLGGPGRILGAVISDPLMRTEDWPQGWMATCFQDSGNTRYVVHIVNGNQTLKAGEDGLVGHSDVIPAFSDTMYSSAMPPQDCKPRLQLRLDGARIGNVRLHTPEKEDALELLWTIKEGRLAIDVPPRAFRGYAVIEAEKIC